MRKNIIKNYIYSFTNYLPKPEYLYGVNPI